MLGGQNDGVQVGQVVVRLPFLVGFVKLDLLLLRVFRDRPLRGRAVRGWWRVSAHFIGGCDRTEITKGNVSMDSAALRATRYSLVGSDGTCTRLCQLLIVPPIYLFGCSALPFAGPFVSFSRELARARHSSLERLSVHPWRWQIRNAMPHADAIAKRSRGHRHIGTSLHGAGDMMGR